MAGTCQVPPRDETTRTGVQITPHEAAVWRLRGTPQRCTETRPLGAHVQRATRWVEKADMLASEQEMKELIVKALMLEDVKPEDIESGAPLFGDGLGLDSIDALELAMAIEQRYKVSFDPDDERNRAIFSSVHALSTYVRSQMEAAK